MTPVKHILYRTLYYCFSEWCINGKNENSWRRRGWQRNQAYGLISAKRLRLRGVILMRFFRAQGSGKGIAVSRGKGLENAFSATARAAFRHADQNPRLGERRRRIHGSPNHRIDEEESLPEHDRGGDGRGRFIQAQVQTFQGLHRLAGFRSIEV